jgi:hypothetical protein
MDVVTVELKGGENAPPLAWDRVPWESGPSPIDGKIELRRDAAARHLAYLINASRRLLDLFRLRNDTPLSATIL